MSLLDLVLLCAGALAAGSINGAIGSGSLVTLPILIALGVEPAAAIATNTIAMVLSALGGTLANRKQLIEERREVTPLALIGVLGGVSGALLLLFTSPSAVQIVVPVLIGLALLMVVAQPLLTRWIGKRTKAPADHPYRGPWLRIGVFGTSVYGGYFAAAQGVLLIGVLGLATRKPIRDINGVKNLLTLLVNVAAAAAFAISAAIGHVDVQWLAAGVMAIAAFLGGYFGASVAKRLPDFLLRSLIVIIAAGSLALSIW